MNRIIVTFALAVAGCLASAVAAEDNRRDDARWTSPRIPEAPRPPAVPKTPATKIRSGYGKTVLAWEALSSKYHAKEHDAYQDALEVARADLERQLSGLLPHGGFSASPDVVERLVKAKEVLPETLEDGSEKLTVVKVRLKLELNQGQRDELIRKVRMDEAWDRQVGLGKITLGLLAILTTAAGYFRLEDRTKGYYTGWLRAGALAVLAGLVFAVYRMF